MPRYKLTLEYDGAPYRGWQRVDEGESVQSALERAVQQFCGEKVDVVGAGRTDAGVHASGQVAHIDLPREFSEYTVMSAINYHLLGLDEEDDAFHHRHISVISAEAVNEEFHARFSATARHYEYRILNRRSPGALNAGRVWHVPEELDVRTMQRGADMLLGHHDFTSFRDSQCQAKSPMKTLDYLNVTPAGDEILIATGARSFLHHQVRIMVGSLKWIGTGRWQPEDMRRALAACDRAAAGPTAPAHGLYLVRVDY